MYPFAYHRPRSVEEAAARFAAAEDPRYLAGGQTLLPVLKMRLGRASDLIDLARIEGLAGIGRTTDGALRIGAMTRHADVAAHPEVRAALPALAGLAGGMGDPHIRAMGTLGGSLANNDPAADYAAAALALGATIHTDRRAIAADAFFTGMFETALAPGEIVTAVAFPPAARAGYAKFRQPASRYAMVGVFVALTGTGPRVAVVGAAPCVFRHAAMEAELARDFSPGQAARAITPAEGLNADLHAGADYRAHLVGVMAGRAVAAAMRGA